MHGEVIIDRKQVTPAWLTAVLRQCGALTHGAVAAMTMAADQRELSTNTRMHLHYTGDAQGDRPRYLFLKMVNADMEIASP